MHLRLIRTAAAKAGEKLLRCFRCGSTDVVYNHCKVFCRACGALIENCAGD